MDKMKMPNFSAVTGVGSTGNDSKYFQTTKKGACCLARPSAAHASAHCVRGGGGEGGAPRVQV